MASASSPRPPSRTSRRSRKPSSAAATRLARRRRAAARRPRRRPAIAGAELRLAVRPARRRLPETARGAGELRLVRIGDRGHARRRRPSGSRGSAAPRQPRVREQVARLGEVGGRHADLRHTGEARVDLRARSSRRGGRAGGSARAAGRTPKPWAAAARGRGRDRRPGRRRRRHGTAPRRRCRGACARCRTRAGSPRVEDGRQGRRRCGTARRARLGQHVRGLLVAQDQQVGLVDEARASSRARRPDSGAAPTPTSASGLPSARVPGAMASARRAGRAAAAAGAAQGLEHGAAGEHHRVGGADAAHHRRRIGGLDAFAPRQDGAGPARGDQVAAGQRAAKRVEQGVVARIALAESAGEDDLAHSTTPAPAYTSRWRRATAGQPGRSPSSRPRRPAPRAGTGRRRGSAASPRAPRARRGRGAAPARRRTSPARATSARACRGRARARARRCSTPAAGRRRARRPRRRTSAATIGVGDVAGEAGVVAMRGAQGLRIGVADAPDGLRPPDHDRDAAARQAPRLQRRLEALVGREEAEAQDGRRRRGLEAEDRARALRRVRRPSLDAVRDTVAPGTASAKARLVDDDGVGVAADAVWTRRAPRARRRRARARDAAG